MNDFETLKEIFTMAELLTSEENNQLEIETVDEVSDKTATITFNFNSDGELTGAAVTE